MNKRKSDLLIFDLDGTLMDTKKDIVNSVNLTLQEFGLECLDQDKIEAFVGKGVDNLIRDALAVSGNEALFKQAMKRFKQNYWDHMLDETCLYPGVVEVMNHYSKQPKAVVTNKPYDYTIEILKGLGSDSFFEEIIGGDVDMPKKPEPDILIYLYSKYKSTPETTWMIGDSWVDMQAGAKAKVNTCFVTYGFGKKEHLIDYPADYMINNIQELVEIIPQKEGV